MSEIGGSGQGMWSPAYLGTTADGQEVTVSFGQGPKNGETLLADGYAASKRQFDHNHDHYFPNGEGTTRGAYTGYGS